MLDKAFLARTLRDARERYAASCSDALAPQWDYVVVTASNRRQAAAFEAQIEERRRRGALPARTRILVVPDDGGRRVGSGGATLDVLRILFEELGEDAMLERKVLLLHSGGDSKRIPQYSACGKLFSPVPSEAPDGSPSTVFDELLVAMSGVPERAPAGMMVASGDTVMLFSSLQLDFSGCDALALSMKAPAAEGSQHGVFLRERGSGTALRFMHKRPEAELRACGAVDGRGMVDIDTGCVFLCADAVRALLGLIERGGSVSEEARSRFVDPEVRMNFYADFVHPLARDAEWREYVSSEPEYRMSPQLEGCRKEAWDALHGLRLRVCCLAPSEYLHAGTTREMLRLAGRGADEHSLVGWTRQVASFCPESACACSGSVVEGGGVDEGSYIEDSIVRSGSEVGSSCVCSLVELDGEKVPDGVVLSAVPLEDGRWVCRLLGVDDNPKGSPDSPFLGSTLREIAERLGMGLDEIWESGAASIWNARLFPAAQTRGEAVRAALSFLDAARSGASGFDAGDWSARDRESFESSFLRADVSAILEARSRIREEALRRTVVSRLAAGEDSRKVVGCLRLPETREFAAERAGEEAFPVNMRLALLASDAYAREGARERAAECEDEAYRHLREAILEAAGGSALLLRGARFARDAAECSLPVRLNFCGSPSDAAPYCVEHGGNMVDAAVLLDGRRPVWARAERIERPVVRLESEDASVSGEFSTFEAASSCGNPSDPLNLAKSVLVATGLLPKGAKGPIAPLCDAMGGGLRLVTRADVPKGSGLGTSSIVAAAAVIALCGAFGVDCGKDEAVSAVFSAEQLMGTGGGWQDQAAGISSGVVFMRSDPGLSQRVLVDRLSLSEEVRKEIDERLVLVFSGQRRLARDVLRKETNRCIRREEGALASVARIREICALMRFRLETGDVDGFAHLLDEQFSLVRTLDEGASNPCIDYIFDLCEDLVEGRSILGAGGGGFLQMILKRGVAREEVRSRIEDRLGDSGVRVWDCSVYWGDSAACEEEWE